VIIKRPNDKRQVVFYKDPSVAVSMPEDIVKLWRSATVDGMDDKKIADYLDKHGFSFIKNEQKLPVSYMTFHPINQTDRWSIPQDLIFKV
jgi:hypothetical protein